MNGSSDEVTKCTSTECPLYLYRFGKGDKKANLSPLKFIRKKCMDCSDNSYKETKDCRFNACELHFFRLGKNPGIKRPGNGRKFVKRAS